MSRSDFLYSSFLSHFQHQPTSCQEDLLRKVAGFVSDDDADILVVNMTDNFSNDETDHIVNIAKKAEVPLVFFGRPIDKSILDKYTGSVYIGGEYQSAQGVQGEMIGKYLLNNYELFDVNDDGKISYVIYADKNYISENGYQHNVEKINRILSVEGKPAIEYYAPDDNVKYYTDNNTLEVYNSMKDILLDYNENNNNMVELVIAERDEWALCALEALNSYGYNEVRGTKIIPLFGIGGTIAAQNAINGGMMAGTVSPDSDYMAKQIEKVCRNILKKKDKLEGVDEEIVDGKNRITIPFIAYYARNSM